MTIYHVHISPWLRHSFAFATRKQQERTSQSDAFRAAEKGMLFTSDVTSRRQWIVDMDDGGLQMVAEWLQVVMKLYFVCWQFCFLVFLIFPQEGMFLFWRVGLVGRGTGCCRGLDYPGVTAVIQLGAPDSRHEYVHRVGRTGRAAAEGGPCSLHPIRLFKFAALANDVYRWNMLLSGANDDEMILNRMLPISWQVQHLNHTSPCKYGRIQEELSLQ